MKDDLSIKVWGHPRADVMGWAKAGLCGVRGYFR